MAPNYSAESKSHNTALRFSDTPALRAFAHGDRLFVPSFPFGTGGRVCKPVPLCRKGTNNLSPCAAQFCLYARYPSSSSSASQSDASASDGMRRSPRGETPTDPTLGPSGEQLRLNCCEKNRR